MNPVLAKVLNEAMDKKLKLILQEYSEWTKKFDNAISYAVHDSFWEHAFTDFGEYLYEEFDNVVGKEEISTTFTFLRDNGIGIRPTGYEFYAVEEETTDKGDEE